MINLHFKKNIIAVFLPLFIVIAGGCHSSKPSGDVGNAQITDTYWRLTELMGKPVPAAPPDKKQVYLWLKKDGNLQAFAGCNGVGGRFEIKEGMQISFSNIMGTMMACDDLANENKLLEALRETDNYIHHGKALMLNKGKKAPLARFEADYSKQMP